MTITRFWPHNEWFRVEAAMQFVSSDNAVWNALFAEGFQGIRGSSGITPALPLKGVRLVLSYYERGTASAKAWWWLSRTEIDDDAEVAAIREWQPRMSDAAEAQRD